MTWDPKDDIYKHFAMTPDNQLLQWEKWIKIRYDEVQKLALHVMKKPADLAMNLGENIRPDIERKQTLVNAQIEKKAKMRGRLYEQPLRLKQLCPCPCENVYEYPPTLAQLGRPNITEHINCPDYIKQTDKCLLGKPERQVCLKLNAEYYKYRNKREDDLSARIAVLDPYRPDTSELVIVGSRPQPAPKKPPPLPSLTYSIVPGVSYDALTGIYALRINNTIVFKQIPEQPLPYLQKLQNEPWHEFCSSWTYYFNIPEKRIGRSKIFLQNLGTVALRYCWKKIKKVIPFLPEEAYEQKFFFNKNEDVISPGQSKPLYVTFVSDKPGIYNESWELAIMNICLFDSLSDKLTFHFTADAVENLVKMSNKVETLQLRIEKMVMRRYLLSMLNDLVTVATSPEYQMCPYKHFLLEAELFIARNPVCFYHQTEVQTMKSTYTKMTGQEWDLSITTWKDALVQKDFDERMMYYDQLKQSFAVLLKPWQEGEELLLRKRRAVKILLGQLMDKFYDEYNSVSEGNGVLKEPWDVDDVSAIMSPILEGPLTADIIRNIFFLRMRDHLASTMEVIAGIVSSLDLQRWIDFDFCQW